MVCQLTDDQAYEVMMQAHKYGSAVVGQYSQETAEVRRHVLRWLVLFIYVVLCVILLLMIACMCFNDSRCVLVVNKVVCVMLSMIA